MPVFIDLTVGPGRQAIFYGHHGWKIFKMACISRLQGLALSRGIGAKDRYAPRSIPSSLIGTPANQKVFAISDTEC